MDGAGHRYLIQHSAGSGKSNSIAWLAHQLVELRRDNAFAFDSVIVITDRVHLDRQIRDTIRQFAQVSAVVGHAETSAHLRQLLAVGKKIIITTLQKFPFVVDQLDDGQRSGNFAVLIDEAHSSQGGSTSHSMHAALADEAEDAEDAIAEVIASRRMPENVSFFAFTATPKRRTLRLFGEAFEDEDGEAKWRPFHLYTMKQAIQEGFIMDVLEHYTPVSSYYRIVQQAAEDPEVDVRETRKELRDYVENHRSAIAAKAAVMVEHFHDSVVTTRKIGGQAKAMVVANRVDQALSYYYAISAELRDRGAKYGALIAFSGERDFRGERVSEASVNGFSAGLTAQRFKSGEYKFLIVADKFQTGFDEPLLHSMYVDKPLAGVQAVQTLSRLNRAHPQKRDTFVLDFAGNEGRVEAAFSDYYTGTWLSGTMDPDKLHDLREDLDQADVYSWDQVVELTTLYLRAAERPRLDAILDEAVDAYVQRLSGESQIKFKSQAKSFVRTYNFLSCVLPYGNAEWEQLATFLGFLVSKLPSPPNAAVEVSVLDAVDMDSYRVEVRTALQMELAEETAELPPIEEASGGGMSQRQHDLLSAVVASFNEQFGNIQWRDSDKIREAILVEIPARVAADNAYQNALRQADPQNARIEHDRALSRVVTDLVADQTELFKQFSDNDGFRRWMQDNVFSITYGQAMVAGSSPQTGRRAPTWDSVVGPFLSNEELSKLGLSLPKEALLRLVTLDGEVVYPTFQLRHGILMPALDEIRERWPDDSDDQWTLAAWLVSPQRGLGNQSVVERLWSSPDDTHVALLYFESHLRRQAS